MTALMMPFRRLSSGDAQQAVHDQRSAADLYLIWEIDTSPFLRAGRHSSRPYHTRQSDHKHISHRIRFCERRRFPHPISVFIPIIKKR